MLTDPPAPLSDGGDAAADGFIEESQTSTSAHSMHLSFVLGADGEKLPLANPACAAAERNENGPTVPLIGEMQELDFQEEVAEEANSRWYSRGAPQTDSCPDSSASGL